MIVNILIVTCVLSCFKIICLSDTYKIRNLESNEVCQQYKRIVKRITTGSDGLIVKENTYFDNLSGDYAFTCRFEVETGFKSQFPGMFVVIQKLQLRKNPKTQQCIDYIQFRPTDKDIFSEISLVNFNLKRNKNPWTKFCGDLSARRDGSRINPDSIDLAETGFISDNTDTIEVEVYIEKIPTHNESLQLEVVFTPYTVCKGMWSEYKECGMNKCIKKQSFDDGIVNCPFLNCPDEGGCDISIIGDTVPPDLRTKVTLTAVTSIFCSFFLFLGCIWCCRYFELLCWSANTLLGRPNPVELSPMRQPSPSAPPPDSTQNKDLPPAYETLFPERCMKFEFCM